MLIHLKNKAGIISGLIIGIAGFLLLFKFFVLVNIPPSDEIAPGMVLMAAVGNGLLFAFLGSLIQQYAIKKRSDKMPEQGRK